MTTKNSDEELQGLTPSDKEAMREKLSKLEVPKMVVWVDKEMKVETTHLTEKTVDDILTHFDQAIEDARLDELEKILEAGGGHDFINQMANAVGYVGKRYQELAQLKTPFNKDTFIQAAEAVEPIFREEGRFDDQPEQLKNPEGEQDGK